MSFDMNRLSPRLAAMALWLGILVFAPALGAQEKLSLDDTLGRSPYSLSQESWRWDEEGKNLVRGTKLFDPISGKEIGDAPARKRDAERRRPTEKKGEVGHQGSPDGKYTGFVRDSNLFIREDEGGKETAVSTDGSVELLYGRLDWVYQEEVYGRGDFNGMWWSPTSKQLAYLRIDESQVREFTVVDHIPTRLELETTNYPKAGDENPVATLGVFDVAGAKTTWMDLSRYEGQEPLIVRVGWNPAGDKLIFQIQDRIQTWLDLVEGDPSTGETKVLIHETSESWVNVLEPPHWLSDGSFLWWSERTGYRNLYRYAADGKLLNAVTSGDAEHDSIVKIDEKAGLLWFTGGRPSAVGKHLFRVGLDGKNEVALTPERGTHSAQPNADGTLILDRFTSLEMPPKIVLRDSEGKVLRVLFESEFKAGATYSKPELVEIKARDGFPMDAVVTKPHGFDPNKKYPILLDTYSGPNAPTVRDSFSTSTWQQFLAQEGIISFQCNNRTSSVKGQATTAKCYKQFGVQELMDLEDAVAWLGKQPWADTTRVGIRGWSYGGFMAAYALTHSKVFTLGIAGAGVYDWRDYDTIYTERYMSTPQKNAEGYKKSSCIAAAADLHGHLLLIHGTMDDNVHLQNTIQFAYALQQAGKHFDMMLYPKSRHGVGDPRLRKHLRELEWKTICEHLLTAPAAVETGGGK